MVAVFHYVRKVIAAFSLLAYLVMSLGVGAVSASTVVEHGDVSTQIEVGNSECANKKSNNTFAHRRHSEEAVVDASNRCCDSKGFSPCHMCAAIFHFVAGTVQFLRPLLVSAQQGVVAEFMLATEPEPPKSYLL